ncbi:hypothetical protein ALHIDCOG_00063 [Klebsiella phage CPRSB]|nr:hypothetical protein ALHIDCOG_00063 [Klebsiella phage CPRSB]
MEIVMKATYAGYCLEAKGVANNGKKAYGPMLKQCWMNYMQCTNTTT